MSVFALMAFPSDSNLRVRAGQHPFRKVKTGFPPVADRPGLRAATRDGVATHAPAF
jgi:hypothetical protein